MRKTKAAARFVVVYICCLGVYRAMYVYNWVMRYLSEPDYASRTDNLVTWICGIIQVCLFAVAILYVMVAKKAKDQLIQKDLEEGETLLEAGED